MLKGTLVAGIKMQKEVYEEYKASKDGVIKDIISLEQLSFKDRDDMEEIFSSYLKKHPFDMEKLRDQRMRHHFADRYDFRRNAVDWDYQFGIRLMVTTNIV